MNYSLISKYFKTKNNFEYDIFIGIHVYMVGQHCDFTVIFRFACKVEKCNRLSYDNYFANSHVYC